MKFNVISIALLLLSAVISCSERDSSSTYRVVDQVLFKLSEIKTASYVSTGTAYNIYDTIHPTYVADSYIKEYTNFADTLVKAKYVRLDARDTTKMEFIYDGFMRSRVHWEEGSMEVDSFRTMRFPWREVRSPFFTRSRAILEYIKNTEDSISSTVQTFRDSLAINLVIYDTINVVDFIMGDQQIYYPQVKKMYEIEPSRYTIWIDSETYLPMTIKRDLPHSISVERVSGVRLNKDRIENFMADAYMPNLPLRPSKARMPMRNLVGQQAPSWSLTDSEDQTITLEDYQGKAVLLEFTGLGCGPCHAAVPFLKELAEDIEIVSIETWSNNIEANRRYKEKQGLNFPLLFADDKIEQQYSIQSVPAFFLLDQDHKIIKRFNGFNAEKTGKEIREVVKAL